MRTKVISFRVNKNEEKELLRFMQKLSVYTIKEAVYTLLQPKIEEISHKLLDKELPENICKTTGEPLKDGYGCFKTIVSCHHIRIDGMDW
jgi:hypothetical protein